MKKEQSVWPTATNVCWKISRASSLSIPPALTVTPAWRLAPATFGKTAAYAFVHTQPQTAEHTRQALRAPLACPTGSIGTVHRHQLSAVRTDFPLHLDNGVFFCGDNSPKSYGGNSYFVQHADGNWLIEPPNSCPHWCGSLRLWAGYAGFS